MSARTLDVRTPGRQALLIGPLQGILARRGIYFMYNTGVRFFILSLAIFCAIPAIAFGAETTFFGSIVPDCPMYGGTADVCRACDLVKLADNIIKFFVVLSVLVASLLFAWAGFLYVTAASSKSNLDQAKNIFFNVLIGLVLVLAAWLIVDLLLRAISRQSLNVLTQIQCVDYKNTVGGAQQPSNDNVVQSGQSVQNPATTQGAAYNPPTGSCANTSQQLASRADIQETSNCNPAQRVANYGAGDSTISKIQNNYGQVIGQCANEQGIPSSVLVSISRLECSGASTCKDPANTGTACQRGGYGATGVSCSAVRSYCKGSTNAACNGVSTLSDSALVQRIQENPGLSFCATARSMKGAYSRYGDWGLAAASYNGAGGLAPSKDCKGYMVMQCPVATGNSPFPYCNVTCAYYDVFNDTAKKAGGLSSAQKVQIKFGSESKLHGTVMNLAQYFGIATAFAVASTDVTASGGGSEVKVQDFTAAGDVVALEDPYTGEQYYSLGSQPSDGAAIITKAAPTLPTAESRGFEILYFPQQGTFAAFIFKEPIGEVRKALKVDLEKRLGLAGTDLCKVTIDLRVSPYTNPIYAGKPLGLPGCNGSQEFPGD